MKLSSLFTVLAALLLITSCRSGKDSAPALIPQPVDVKVATGHFSLKPDARVSWSGGAGAAVMAEEIAAMLRPVTGYELPTAEGIDGEIRLVIEAGTEWKKEEYRLKVERKSVTITAGSSEGLFRGIQTAMQLLPPRLTGERLLQG